MTQDITRFNLSSTYLVLEDNGGSIPIAVSDRIIHTCQTCNQRTSNEIVNTGLLVYSQEDV